MQMLRIAVRRICLGLVVSCLAGPVRAEAIKIAFIDPLSGPAAAIGEGGLRHFKYAAEQIIMHGGANGKSFDIETYGRTHNPQHSMVSAQKALDAGMRFI